MLRLGEMLAVARDRHPLLEIELHHEVSGAAFAKVRDGELDASFYYGPLGHPGDCLGTAENARVPRGGAGGVAWSGREASDAEIAALPWIMTPPISTHHALATHFFAARGLAPASVVEADNEARDPFARCFGRRRCAAARRCGACRRLRRTKSSCGNRRTSKRRFSSSGRTRAVRKPPLAALIALVRASWPEGGTRPGESVEGHPGHRQRGTTATAGRLRRPSEAYAPRSAPSRSS